VQQALSFEFPAHPEFNADDVRLGRKYIELAYTEVLRALRDPEGRKTTEKEVRKQIRPLLEPLRLAQVTEQNTVTLREWHDRFDGQEAQHGGPVTVGKLRAWMDEPKRMGLPVDLQDLIILVYAAQSNRSFRDAYGPADATVGRLRDEWRLQVDGSLTASEQVVFLVPSNCCKGAQFANLADGTCGSSTRRAYGQ